MKRNGVSIRKSCVAILSALFLLGMVTPCIVSAQTKPAAADTKIDPKDLTGQWQGTSQAPVTGAQGQRIVFVITKGDGGAWKTVFNFIDLIAKGQGIPRAANLTLQGWNVQIAVPGNSGQYQGQLSSDGKTIIGTWTQGGPDAKLDLVRATPDIAWEVPKPPPPPKAMDPNAKPAFDVATIKPNQEGGGGKGFGIRGRTFSTFNTSLADLIVFAYDVHNKQILNGPDWIDKDKYDITGVPDTEGAPSNQQWKMMVQKLLTERFQLTFHHEKREMPVYILSVAKGGPEESEQERRRGRRILGAHPERPRRIYHAHPQREHVGLYLLCAAGRGAG